MTQIKDEPIFSDALEPKKDDGPAIQPEFDNLTNMIEDVLRETRERFQAMSDMVIHRIDEMTKRVDSLEKNITDLLADSAAHGGDSDK